MTHLGLQLPSFTFPGVPTERMFDRIAETVLAAEESGFDSFWVMDHYHQIPTVSPETDPMLDAYTLLAGVGARTSRISLGTLVTGVVYRNPAFLAKVVTTLDVVSSGRAILGIGAAWNQHEAEAYGYQWPSTRERMERLEDALRICKAMFTRERSTVEGRHHQVRGALNIPQPVRPGGPPIMIGGGGEQRTLRLVARYADMWNGFGDLATIRHKLEVLAGHCRDAGRDPAEIVKTRLGTLLIAPTMDEAKQRLTSLDMSEERRQSALTWGDPETVVEQARTFLDAGLDGLIFNLPVGSTPRDVELAGRTLSQGLK
jgi:F420-dependent oxidoreductase-like protein